jgi:hypothetical protein
MPQKWILMLEELVLGKCDTVEFTECSRDEIVDEINHLLLQEHPRARISGKFVNPSQADYLAYDLHMEDEENEGSIRLLDFGDKLVLVRM